MSPNVHRRLTASDHVRLWQGFIVWLVSHRPASCSRTARFEKLSFEGCASELSGIAVTESLSDNQLSIGTHAANDRCCCLCSRSVISVAQALGFAGPSYIPKQPNDLWSCAVHNADVLFFWDAAEDWRVAEVSGLGCSSSVGRNLPQLLCWPPNKI